MEFPGRPHRLPGFDYGQAGRVFHCRLAVAQRAPVFRDERWARVLAEALEHYQTRSVHLFAFCIMPDHVHLLLALRPGVRSLPRWVGDLKRWVTRGVARDGGTVVWQKSFFERVLRNDDDLVATAKYIVANPVRAGLVEHPREYPWAGSLEWELWSDADG